NSFQLRVIGLSIFGLALLLDHPPRADVERIVIGAPEGSKFVGSKRSAAATESAGDELVGSQKSACCWITEGNEAGVAVFAILLVQFDGEVLGRRPVCRSRHHCSAKHSGDPISHQFSRFRLAKSSTRMQ